MQLKTNNLKTQATLKTCQKVWFQNQELWWYTLLRHTRKSSLS